MTTATATKEEKATQTAAQSPAKKVTTKQMVWFVDTEARKYLRMPKSESLPAQAMKAFEGEWVAYDKLVDNGFMLTFKNVQYHGGTNILTGEILSREGW